MKIAFVGNSHLLAYKSAEDQIRERLPGVELSFFTLRNPDFFRNGLKNSDGLPFDAATFHDGHAMIDPAGPDRVTFESYDHVFLTSHGFYLGPLLELLACFDILDLTPAGPAEMISWPCLQSITQARLKYYTRRLNAFFPLGRNVTIVQMPYPAAQAVGTHPHLAAALGQPDLDTVFTRYNVLISDALSPLDAQYQPVPRALLDRSFVTRGIYARSHDLDPGNPIRDADHTHMNAAFAMKMLDKLLPA